jgi:predicted nucleic acid-binding protein
MRLPSCLVDTNVLLRIAKRDDPLFPVASQAIDLLLASQTPLFYTFQNIAEMWNVMTRPLERNGFGLALENAAAEVRVIESAMRMLPEDESSYRHWRSLLSIYKICGLQVHDTRLVAAMVAQGVQHILTFNTSHFARFGEIHTIRPQDVPQNARS